MQDTQKKPEKAVLVNVELPGETECDWKESLDELARLASTAGAEVVGRTHQKQSVINAPTLVGRGKAAELSVTCAELDAGMVIVDRELTAAQIRNLEEATGSRVIDRSMLILDIFARHARTREGKLQVELAQLNYLLPRLTGKGTQLSRLGGGIGTRGPGETKLETDRRRIKKRIADIKQQIEEVRNHRQLIRQARKEVPYPLVAVVGYTNAGKSTLLNRLTGASALVEDKLFATLDPTTRRLLLPNRETVLVTDTVGFVRNLPHHLVAAFRATLEETAEADLLLHVVDISHPAATSQAETVHKVLESLGAGSKPEITVYNKIDQLAQDGIPLLSDHPDHVYVSAATGQGIDGLLEKIAIAAARRRVRKVFRLPFARAGLVSFLYDRGQVISEEHDAGGITVEVELEDVWARRFEARLKREETV